MKYNLLLFLAILVLVSSCTSIPLVMQNGQTERITGVKDYFKTSEILNKYFVGFALYDLEKDEYIFEQNSRKFFTPASNTKILTLYTSLKYLADSIAWMNIYKNGDSTIYAPLGDPTFHHPDLKTDKRIAEFFSTQPKGDTILLTLNHFKDEVYGSGWAWDDYQDYYQPEKSPFPVHSNLVTIENGKVNPGWLNAEVFVNPEMERSYQRHKDKNRFTVKDVSKTYHIPFKVDEEVYRAYFKAQGKELKIAASNPTHEKLITTIYSCLADSAYTLLMQNSDNHIAEQLLLQASMLKLRVMNSRAIIEYALDDIFKAVRSEIRWVDGSGLSRYNQITPRALVEITNYLVDEIGLERTQQIYPAGGHSGSIKNWYKYTPPRVFAKTGTLRHNHNLTGLVQAKSGKWYVFSFMNNNFTIPSSKVKTEMQNVLQVVVELY